MFRSAFVWKLWYPWYICYGMDELIMVRIRTDVNSTVNKPLALSIYIPYRIAKVAYIDLGCERIRQISVKSLPWKRSLKGLVRQITWLIFFDSYDIYRKFTSFSIGGRALSDLGGGGLLARTEKLRNARKGECWNRDTNALKLHEKEVTQNSSI